MKNHNNHHSITLPSIVLEIVKIMFQKESEGDKRARSVAANNLKDYYMETADGSFTFYSEELDGISETMHTHHGALEESRQKFVYPSLLEKKLQAGTDVKVLDICSGLGYNAAAALEMWESIKVASPIEIQIDMVEISRETLATALLIPSPISSHKMVKKVIEDQLLAENCLKFKFENSKIPKNVDINVYSQDARVFVKNLINKRTKKGLEMGDHFQNLENALNKEDTLNKNILKNEGVYDAIFLDPFSPRMAPELYTLDFFKSLKQIIKNDGVLLTYTSAAAVRSAIVKAGFHVGEVSSFGRKKGSTIASISPNNISKDLSSDDERMIALSDAGIPFRDPHLNDDGFSVVKRRELHRKIARGTYKIASTVKTPLYINKILREGRLKRRVLKNLQILGLEHPKSQKSQFLVCPQYEVCICGSDCAAIKGSRDRIKEMEERLNKISHICLIDDF